MSWASTHSGEGIVRRACVISAATSGQATGQVGIYLDGPIQPTPDGWLSAGPDYSWIDRSKLIQFLLRFGAESAPME